GGDGVPHAWPEELAQVFLGAQLGRVNETVECPPFLLGHPRRAQPDAGAAEVLDDQPFAWAWQFSFQRPRAPSAQPLHEIDSVDLPLVIDADFLQVIQPAGLERPQPLACWR